MNEPNIMKRYLFLNLLLFCIFQMNSELTDPPKNNILRGTSVLEIIVDSTLIESKNLTLLLMYPTLFDPAFESEEESFIIDSTNTTLQIPTFSPSTMVGVRLDKGDDVVGAGMLTVENGKTVSLEIREDSDKNYVINISNQEGINRFDLIYSPRNYTSQMAEVIMRFLCYHNGLSDDEPDITAEDYINHSQLTQKLDSLYKVQKRYALEDKVFPSDVNKIIKNTMEWGFADNWRLPILERAQRTYEVPNAPKTLPIEYYNFLNDLETTEKILDHTPIFGPYPFFRMMLAQYPFSVPFSRDVDLKDWKKWAVKDLSRNMDNVTDFFVEYLIASAIHKQIDSGEALSEKRCEELKEVLQPELAAILIDENNALLAKADPSKFSFNFENSSFNLQEFIDTEFPGKPVVVDFWEIWCGVCLSSQKQIVNGDVHSEYPDVVSLYVSSTQTSVEEWEKRTLMLQSPSVRISEEDMDKTLTSYMFQGLPAILYFDADHKIVSSNEGWPGLKAFKKELDRIK